MTDEPEPKRKLGRPRKERTPRERQKPGPKATGMKTVAFKLPIEQIDWLKSWDSQWERISASEAVRQAIQFAVDEGLIVQAPEAK